MVFDQLFGGGVGNFLNGVGSMAGGAGHFGQPGGQRLGYDANARIQPYLDRIQPYMNGGPQRPSGLFPLNPGGGEMQPLNYQTAQAAQLPAGAGNRVMPGMQNSVFRGF